MYLANARSATSGRALIGQRGHQYDASSAASTSQVDAEDADDQAATHSPIKQSQSQTTHQMQAAVAPTQPEHLLQCRCDSARNIATLLQCLKDVSATESANEGHQQQRIKSRRTSTKNRMQPVTIFCSPTGLTFHVSTKSKQSQASVEWPAAMCSFFQVFATAPDDPTQPEGDAELGGEFCINLTTLLDCLSVVVDLNIPHSIGGSGSGGNSGNRDGNDNSGGNNGANSNSNNNSKSLNSGKRQNPVEMSWSYSLRDEILRMELDPNSAANTGPSWLCTSAIPGMIPPDDVDQGLNHTQNMVTVFSSHPVAARILAPSSLFQGVVSELQMASGAATVTIRMGYPQSDTDEGGSRNNDDDNNNNNNNDRLVLEFIAKGYTGECVVHMTDMTGTWILGQHPTITAADGSKVPPSCVQYSYSLPSVLQSMRPLDLAQETCLSINTQGMMALQHQIVFESNNADREDAPPAFCDFVLCPLQDESDDNVNGNNNAINIVRPLTRYGGNDYEETEEDENTTLATGGGNTQPTQNDRQRRDLAEETSTNLASRNQDRLVPSAHSQQSVSTSSRQRSRTSGSQDDHGGSTGFQNNDDGDDDNLGVDVGSRGGSKIAPQKQKKASQMDDIGSDDDDDNGKQLLDTESETEFEPPVAAPLFGTVASLPTQSDSMRRRQRRRIDRQSLSALATNSASLTTTSSPLVAEPKTLKTLHTKTTPRRKTRSMTKKRKSAHDSDNDDANTSSQDDGNNSVNLLGSSRDEEDSDIDDDIDDSQLVVNDNQSRQQPRVYDDDQYCSSPEMVYE